MTEAAPAFSRLVDLKQWHVDQGTAPQLAEVTAASLAAHKAAGRAQGIDVSNHQGAFDWEQWRGRIDFAMVKATEGGGFFDPDFPANWQAMWDVFGGKLARFFYSFVHPGEAVQPQVDACFSYAEAHGIKDGDHAMIDLEVTDGCGPAEVSAFGVAFCAAMNRKRDLLRCIDYTYENFADTGNCEGQWRWRLFIADLGVSQPAVPPPWRDHGLEWSFWQDQWSPAPDRDVYRGTRAELAAFCRFPPDRM